MIFKLLNRHILKIHKNIKSNCFLTTEFLFSISPNTTEVKSVFKKYNETVRVTSRLRT